MASGRHTKRLPQKKMTVHLSGESLKKLTHESSEIRLRTLDQVNMKVRRALAHNETIDFRPEELCKQLIRWFGFQPIQASGKVLQLLMEILSSNYGTKAVQSLRVERLQREMRKVQQLLKGHKDEFALTESIQLLLMNYQKKEDADNEVIEIMDSLTIVDDAASSRTDSHSVSEVCADFSATDYEVPWSKPITADFNSMKIIADILINPQATLLEMQNALQHLQITMSDYPAEFMLQAPNIYLNLLEIYGNTNDIKCPLEDVMQAITVFLKILKHRIKMRSKCVTYATPSKGAAVARAKTQLNISKTLDLLLEKSLIQLEHHILDLCNEMIQIFYIIFKCLQFYAMQSLYIERKHIQKLTKIADMLRDSFNQDEHFIIQRIKYLIVIHFLYDILKNNSSQSQTFALDVSILEPILRDYTLKLNCAQLYENAKELLLTAKPALLKNFELLEKYEKAFTTALEFSKSANNKNNNKMQTESVMIVKAGVSICFILEKLGSINLVELLLNAITNSLAHLELKTEAIELLQNLLRIQDATLKLYIYQHIAQTVRKHFACLMNGETFHNNISNTKLAAAQIIGIPLNSTLIMHLISENFESSNSQIKESCEDILTLVLKSQNLIESQWPALLEILIPVLPLMQCSTHSTKLMQLLLKLCDPDAQNLPFLTILQSNICFLYHRNANTRAECLTRLIYILNIIPDSSDYVPNIMEISDLIPSDICFLQVPRQYRNIFNISEAFNELTTLNNLLSLLETSDIEPVIRKTTLMQLNVMCQSWQMLELFCSQSAHYLILQTIENSLQKSSYTDYTDACIPAISILSKLLFYDTKFRHELAGKTNIYVLLLRALFLYQNDIQVRQDASLCLFQLIFASYLIVVGSTKVELPLICSNLQLPLKCELISNSQIKCSAEDINEIFSNEKEQSQYWGIFIAANLCGGREELTKLNYTKYLNVQKAYDFRKELQLNEYDWRLVKATNAGKNLQRLLKTMSNATNHETITNAIIILKLQLFLNHQYNIDLPADIADELIQMLRKHLQQSPGNVTDLLLFEKWIELGTWCMRFRLHSINDGLHQMVKADHRQICITLLWNPEILLQLHVKLCNFLLHCLENSKNFIKSSANDLKYDFYSNLFETLFQAAAWYFEQRDLQHVRCLLSLIQLLSSSCKINMSNKMLLYYCKRLIQLSIALKSSTQTGAQWQRDCLRTIFQLNAQMKAPERTFILNIVALKYLSGLLGHNDMQVRSLAWCILAQIQKFNKDTSALCGAEILIRELNYLPGGFIACCLCTFLDTTEVIIVRHLAGNLFIDLLSSGQFTIDQIILIIQQQRLFAAANEALSSCCILTEYLPDDFDWEIATTTYLNLNSCEIISCFVNIFIKCIEMQSIGVNELCEKPFMFKLYELMKKPPPTPPSSGNNNSLYYSMCADVCHLYAFCHKENFLFLQRTLCNDSIWIYNFYQQLLNPNNIEIEEAALVKVLQLFLVLCKDATSFEKLCEQIVQKPRNIVTLFLRTFKISLINTSLQRCALAVFALLLIKSQPELKCTKNSFTDILEYTIDVPQQQAEPSSAVVDMEHNKENRNDAGILNERPIKLLKREFCTNIVLEDDNISSNANCLTTNTIATCILIDLLRLFTHLFPERTYKFDTAPNSSKIQISEAISLILMLSPSAQKSAEDLKLLDKILKIFQNFFDELKVPCTTFVRRYGETKKNAIIKNFQVLINILLNWYSSPRAVFTDELQALDLSKVIIQLWPWFVHSGNLRFIVLKMCAFLSERSMIVCVQFSTLISTYANSIIQLIIKMVVLETSKVKSAASTEDVSVISMGLQVLMNCCNCSEGRVALVKSHVLDVIDGLQPFNPKAPKMKLEIIHSWLKFWEWFSRYAEGAQTRNLNSLCTVINRSQPQTPIRILCLEILRNMCFLSTNRSKLISSTDFIYTINEIISQQRANLSTYEEQLLVSVGVWKFISGGVKYVAMIRGTNLAKKFHILREHLKNLEAEDLAPNNNMKQIPFVQDLANALDMIFMIFENA